MDSKELFAQPNLSQYEELARNFVRAYSYGDSDALRRIQEHYQLSRVPTVEELRARTAQRLARIRGSEKKNGVFEVADAQELIADSHGFGSWLKLSEYIEAINVTDSSIARFEAAVDAIVTGDVPTLERLLRDDPELIRARSTREHGATLLHYVSANGVEDFRQKSPKNAVEIAKILLKAGAEVDADLGYDAVPAKGMGQPERIGSTTLGLTATSVHPAHAGVLITLMELLLEGGASLDGLPGGWGFVNACLANGRPEAASFLAKRGARLDVEGGGGVGRLDLVRSFFNQDGSLTPAATREQTESSFTWACEYGHTEVVEFLLDRGVDVGTRVHGMTGMHWTMVGGRLETARLLLERKAPLEAENSYGGTVLGCAIWAVGNSDLVNRWPDSDTDWLAIVQMLIDAGARVYESDSDFPTGNDAVDELLRRHGMKP